MATLKLPRYVDGWFNQKTRRPYYFFRYRGQRWPLPGLPWSPEFMARYEALLRQNVLEPKAANIAFAATTLGAVIDRYLASNEFGSKAHHTRRQYRRILERLKEIAGRGLIADLREDHVRDIRKRFLPATFAADEAVMLLSTLWFFAKEHLAMRLGPNPTADIRKLHKQTREYQPWPQWVIEKFEAEARPNAQLALLLLLYTGQRASDVAAMRWSQYDGRGIEVKQLKTGAMVWIKCHSRLRAALDTAPRRSAFILTTQLGAGYSAGSFCNMVAEATAQIGAKQYTAHGLRKNAAIALAEADCSVPQIMAITGHKTWKQAMHYAARANQRKLSEQAIDKLEAGDCQNANETWFKTAKRH
jgi:integrase